MPNIVDFNPIFIFSTDCCKSRQFKLNENPSNRSRPDTFDQTDRHDETSSLFPVIMHIRIKQGKVVLLHAMKVHRGVQVSLDWFLTSTEKEFSGQPYDPISTLPEKETPVRIEQPVWTLWRRVLRNYGAIFFRYSSIFC